MQDYMGILEGSNDFFKFVLLLSTNVIINASGFLPSAFLTTINLSLYGTFYGTLLSFFGEVVGTQIGFHLYKIGISKIKPSWLKHPFWDKLQSSSVRSVIISIISLRLLPFVPSGLVTAGAALTTIGTWTFMMASTIGKIPSVLIEVLSLTT